MIGSRNLFTSTQAPHKTVNRSGTSGLHLSASLRSQSYFVNGVEVISRSEDSGGGIYGVKDAVDLAWMRDRLGSTPLKSASQPLRLANPAEVYSIPRTHIRHAGGSR